MKCQMCGKEADLSTAHEFTALTAKGERFIEKIAGSSGTSYACVGCLLRTKGVFEDIATEIKEEDGDPRSDS